MNITSLQDLRKLDTGDINQKSQVNLIKKYRFSNHCGVVTKRYDLYFGSCDHIGTRRCLRCLYHVIMFGGPLGDTMSFGDLCSVYKAGCCRSSGLGKK